MTVHLDVQEQAEKKALNTPGADEIYTSLHGSGLPFLAFLDDRGAPLVSSLAPGKDGKPPSNIGHPYEPEEVDWFLVMLGKAAPGMTPDETATIERWLRHQKDK